jgi:hypothetical protein
VCVYEGIWVYVRAAKIVCQCERTVEIVSVWVAECLCVCAFVGGSMIEI